MLPQVSDRIVIMLIIMSQTSKISRIQLEIIHTTRPLSVVCTRVKFSDFSLAARNAGNNESSKLGSSRSPGEGVLDRAPGTTYRPVVLRVVTAGGRDTLEGPVAAYCPIPELAYGNSLDEGDATSTT